MSRRYFASAGGFCMVVINKTTADETAPAVTSSRKNTTRTTGKASRANTRMPSSAPLKRD